MRFQPAVILLVALGTSTAALAQERPGAGRMEVTMIAGSGTLYTTSSAGNDSFNSDMIGGALTYNLNRFVGIEGEVGGGLGMNHTFMNLTLTTVNVDAVTDDDGNIIQDATTTTVQNMVPTRTRSPRTLNYQANLVISPMGNDHTIVPYVTAGVGGLTMFTSSALRDLGLANNDTYLTSNVGAGIKWFTSSGFGVRGDYRVSAIRRQANGAALFALNEGRYGHRITASLEYTFGK